jgi:hypothetical protein
MCNYKPGSWITFIKKEKKIQWIQNTFIFLNAERTQGRRCLEVNSNQYIIMMGNRDTNIMPSEHELEKIFTIM